MKLLDLEKVRSGNFKVPEPRMLQRKADAYPEYAPVRDEDIPFL